MARRTKLVGVVLTPEELALLARVNSSLGCVSEPDAFRRMLRLTAMHQGLDVSDLPSPHARASRRNPRKAA